MIAKRFVLADTIYPITRKFFRDHESTRAGYPLGYPIRDVSRSLRTSAPAARASPRSQAIICRPRLTSARRSRREFLNGELWPPWTRSGMNQWLLFLARRVVVRCAAPVLGLWPPAPKRVGQGATAPSPAVLPPCREPGSRHFAAIRSDAVTRDPGGLNLPRS